MFVVLGNQCFVVYFLFDVIQYWVCVVGCDFIVEVYVCVQVEVDVVCKQDYVDVWCLCGFVVVGYGVWFDCVEVIDVCIEIGVGVVLVVECWVDGFVLLIGWMCVFVVCVGLLNFDQYVVYE